MVIENSIETDDKMIISAELAIESLEKEAKEYAKNTNITYKEAIKKLLIELGYETIEELKSYLIYEIKLSMAFDEYWKDNLEGYYNQFIEDRIPVLVKSILVKIDDNVNSIKMVNNATISQSEAEKLVDIIKDFEQGYKFSYVASTRSEDIDSANVGGAYYIDNTYATQYADEFVYGTYAFDAYTTKVVEEDTVKYVYGANQTKLAKLKGLTDTEAFANYYQDGFNFVDMSIVNMLKEVYNQTALSEKDYFTINAVEKKVGENDEITYSTASGNLNSTENYYARSIIFNRAFNKPGVSVIGYNTKQEAEEAGAKSYVEFKFGDDAKYVLADENGNAIFFIVARNSNQLYLHFLTINASALDDLENAKKFFSLETNSEDNYTTYIELMNVAGTDTNERTLRNELESYIKSYVTKGTAIQIGNQELLKYSILEYYMAKNTITISDETLNTTINDYMNNQKQYYEKLLEMKLKNTWDNYTNKLDYYISDINQIDIKPYECGVWIENNTDIRDNPYTALTTSDYLCRYVYGEGYQVQLSFYYETTGTSSSEYFTKVVKNNNSSNKIYFTDDSNYQQYVTIGASSSNIVLPTPEAKDGFEFLGWYTDKDLTHKVTSIDLSESRMTNTTIFFAKIIEREVE